MDVVDRDCWLGEVFVNAVRISFEVSFNCGFGRFRGFGFRGFGALGFEAWGFEAWGFEAWGFDEWGFDDLF